jgi:hypothetical protein
MTTTLIQDEGFSDDVQEMIDDLPSTLIYFGASIVGTASEVSSSRRVMGEGNEQVYDLQWLGFVSEFTNAPRAGQNCMVDGVGYRIDRVEKSPDNTTFTLYLVQI